jgi:hypothetical protein
LLRQSLVANFQFPFQGAGDRFDMEQRPVRELLQGRSTDQFIGLGMIWNRWRQHLTYLVMSAFVAWHTLAMVIAPASSELVRTLRAALQPYLTLFRLDNPWNFFAPTIGGSQLRYTLEDGAGAHHAFTPTQRLSWFHPDYFWFRDWHYAIIDSPEFYADRAGALLCRKHASLHPVSITLVSYEQGSFTPADQLSGKHPMDPEFITVNIVKTVECPAS